MLAAVAHGELLTLAPFGVADGVVARAVSRLITITSGLDPHGLGVPEVYWMRQSGDYRAAARGIRVRHARRPDGVDPRQLHGIPRGRQGGVGDSSGGIGMTRQQNEAGDAPKILRLVAR